jgi:hypothetical protein
MFQLLGKFSADFFWNVSGNQKYSISTGWRHQPRIQRKVETLAHSIHPNPESAKTLVVWKAEIRP